MSQATVHVLKTSTPNDPWSGLEAELKTVEQAQQLEKDQLEKLVRAVKQRAVALAKAAPELQETETLLARGQQLNLIELDSWAEQTKEARLHAIRAREAARSATSEILARLTSDVQSLSKCCDEVDAQMQTAKAQEAVVVPTKVPVVAPAELAEPAVQAPLALVPARPPVIKKGPKGATGADLREHVRQGLQVEVTVHSASNLYTGFSQNISEGGLFVATTNLAPRGTELDLEFSLPGSATIKAKAVVRWIQDPRDHNDGTTVSGMGVQFLNLDGASAIALNHFIEERDPLFYPEEE